MVKKVGKYELGRTLGEGTFGKVKYAVNTGKFLVCVQFISFDVTTREIQARPASNKRSLYSPIPIIPVFPFKNYRNERSSGNQGFGQGEDTKAKHGKPDKEGNFYYEDGKAQIRSGDDRGIGQ